MRKTSRTLKSSYADAYQRYSDGPLPGRRLVVTRRCFMTRAPRTSLCWAVELAEAGSQHYPGMVASGLLAPGPTDGTCSMALFHWLPLICSAMTNDLLVSSRG